MTEPTLGVGIRTCGVRLDAHDPESAVQAVLERARQGAPAAVHLCNAYTLSLAVRDSAFAELLDRGDLNFMDGTPVVWAARRAGVAIRERVYGPDLMLDTLRAGTDEGISHYLYGSTQDVLDDLVPALEGRAPGARVVGAWSPPFRDLTDEELEAAVQRIVDSGAQVVWVGLGTPKQDRFVDAMRSRLDMPLVAVGAAFDFHAGRKAQAPRWMQQRGLEWLFRLLSEPRRLWRRYLIGNPVFLYGLSRGVEVVEHPDLPEAA